MKFTTSDMERSVHRNRIEKAAIILFAKYGIKGVTVQDITSALAMSKKTFYKYFVSKETLLEQLADDSIAGFKQNVQLLKIKYRGLDQFLWISYYHLFWLRSFKSELIIDIKKYFPETSAKYYLFKDHYVLPHLTELIHEAKINGSVRADVDEGLFCKVQLNLIEGVVHDRYQFLTELDQSSLFDHLVLNNLKGILNSSYQLRFTIENIRLDLKEVG